MSDGTSDYLVPDKRAVVIVDAISSAALLAPELHKRGFGRVSGGGPLIDVMVLMPEKMPPAIAPTHVPSNFDVLIAYESLEKTIAKLTPYAPTAILAGSETGVLVADQLSEALGLRTNGTALSEARRNKYLMGETVRAHGVPTVRQMLVRTCDDAMQFQRTHGEWPVVIKPVHSAAGDGFSICHTEKEVAHACSGILGATNALALENTEILVQEFLDGDEYVLNTVSLDGRALVTDMWIYRKRDIQGPAATYRVYDRDEILPYHGDVQEKIMAYGTLVRDALGIRNGPAHMEIMLTKRGPILVEVGARIMGGNTLPVSICTGGRSQVELTIDAYLFPDSFVKGIDKPYTLLQNSLTVNLISHGGLARPGFMTEVRKLPSYHSGGLASDDEVALPKTVDLFSSPGKITLIHSDPEQLRKDAGVLDTLEEAFFVTNASKGGTQ